MHICCVGGSFFLATPPLVRGLFKIMWVLKLNAFLLLITKIEVSKCLKWLHYSSLTSIQNILGQKSLSSENCLFFATYLTGQNFLYAFDTMIFVLNGKKKRGIDYPHVYQLLGGGSFFLNNPSPGQGVEQNHVGTQIECLFIVFNENGSVREYKMTALEFTYKDS